jgi:hypothetical protein
LASPAWISIKDCRVPNQGTSAAMKSKEKEPDVSPASVALQWHDFHIPRCV